MEYPSTTTSTGCIRCIFSKVNGAALLYLVVVLSSLVSPFSCPLIFMTMAALESYNEPYLSFVERFSTDMDMDKIFIYYNYKVSSVKSTAKRCGRYVDCL